MQNCHCISVTLQTCTEQHHIGGSNTQNGYMYIKRSQNYRRQVFFRPDARGIETRFCKPIPLR